MKNESLFALIIVLSIFSAIFFITYQNKTITSNVILNQKQEQIIIPIKIHLIKDTSGQYTSYRSSQNIVTLIQRANKIWEQANIHFKIEEITITEVSFNAIPDTLNDNPSELINHENFDNTKINVFLVQSLNNINGIGLPSHNLILVSDYTTVNDYRTTAHEFGHVLSLRHVPNSSQLMARGKNGVLLFKDEILKARSQASLS
jgi:hypothetical protein